MKRESGSVALILILVAVVTASAYIVLRRTNDEPDLSVRDTSPPSIVPDSSLEKPYAWIGQAYSGKIGKEIEFDASGSYGPQGYPIVTYEWDFDADGVYDLETKQPNATHVYTKAFNDLVALRVTDTRGGTRIATARTVINEQGYVSQGDESPCPLDENGYSIIIGADGAFLNCTPDHLPTQDQGGVKEVVGN